MCVWRFKKLQLKFVTNSLVFIFFYVLACFIETVTFPELTA
jgi:hypothetical protein